VDFFFEEGNWNIDYAKVTPIYSNHILGVKFQKFNDSLQEINKKQKLNVFLAEKMELE